jgi:predicted Fe-Mo cluster-binding NifX family protein
MIIAIPSISNVLPASVSPQFGRSPYFYIYDLTSEDGKFIPNSALHSPGGAGVRAADQIVNLNVDVLIAPNIGEKAMSVFRRTSIKIISIVGSNVTETINIFKQRNN